MSEITHRTCIQGVHPLHAHLTSFLTGQASSEALLALGVRLAQRYLGNELLTAITAISSCPEEHIQRRGRTSLKASLGQQGSMTCHKPKYKQYRLRVINVKAKNKCTSSQASSEQEIIQAAGDRRRGKKLHLLASLIGAGDDSGCG